MNKNQFLNLLDELQEVAHGTIKGDERLEDLPRWDSLAVIGFIAMLDEQFSLNVPAAKINDCKTVGDLMALVGDRIKP